MIFALYIQLIATLMMGGMIWFIQIVHYPLFLKIQNHTEYFVTHQKRTSLVVIPLMLAEGSSVIALAMMRTSVADIMGALLLAIIWISTFLIQVPLHQSLAQKFTQKGARALVRTNWIRTILWSARLIVVTFFIQ